MKRDPLTLEEREMHTALLLLHLKGLIASAGELGLELPAPKGADAMLAGLALLSGLPDSFPAAALDVTLGEKRISLREAAQSVAETWAHYARPRSPG